MNMARLFCVFMVLVSLALVAGFAAVSAPGGAVLFSVAALSWARLVCRPALLTTAPEAPRG